MRLLRNIPAGFVALLTVPETTAAAEKVVFQPQDFRIIRKESGPKNYYSVLGEGSDIFIRGEYVPPLKSVVLGVKIPPASKKEPHKLRWRWRARQLPQNGNECEGKTNDSAAVVYLVFKDGLHWYTLKYVWSTTVPKGVTCDRSSSPVNSQDTIVRESGGPLNEWVTEEIDPTAEFRAHFCNGDPKGHVPDLVGIGIMTDGDDTKSESSADYASFELGP